MPELLRVPEVLGTADEAILAARNHGEDDPFHAGDVLAVIETAKASVDIEAHQDGYLVRWLVEPGDRVAAGDPVALIAGVAEAVTDPHAPLTTALPRGERAAAPPVQHARLFASPLARRTAQEKGIALQEIVGTGPGGRIIRADVDAAAALTGQRGASELSGAAPGASQRIAPPTRVDRVRRAIATRLSESKSSIPHFYLTDVARVGELLKLREQANRHAAEKVSVTDLILRAVALALRTVPQMNAVWSGDGVERLPAIDVGVAVATPSGVIAPVIRGVDQLSLSAINATCRELAQRARDGSVDPSELAGGATTVTNLGMYGARQFTAIINPPQSSILAVGSVTSAPVITRKGRVRAARVMHLTASVDHRPVDGTTAAQWLAAVRELLENPVRMLL